MAEKKMDICEIYPTIKSSGMNAGKSVLCIRLFGTDFKDNKDNRRYAWDKKPANLVLNRKRMFIKEVINEIGKNGAFDRWLITGGEPLLQQDMILLLIKEHKKVFKGKKPRIEIETNGFIEPIKALNKLVDSYCINIKLSNTMGGTPKSTFGSRIQENVLGWFAENLKSYFMFSVESQSDITEVIEIQRLFKLDSDDIYLKPHLIDSRGVMRGMNTLWAACLNEGYTLSNRFYVHVHGNVKRGI